MCAGGARREVGRAKRAKGLERPERLARSRMMFITMGCRRGDDKLNALLTAQSLETAGIAGLEGGGKGSNEAYNPRHILRYFRFKSQEEVGTERYGNTPNL